MEDADERSEGKEPVDERDGSSEEHIALERTATPSASSPRSAAGYAPVLRFERGKTYAIIGQNQSGKSTLMEILCKLHPTDPTTSPHIEVNSSASDQPPLSFEALPRMSFRSVLSYVPQRPFIFPGTIEDNVRMGDTGATAEQVEAAAEAAGLFLYDQEREGRLADEAQVKPPELKAEWKGEIQRKPWESDRVGDTVRRLWGWAVTAWKSQWWRVGDELDDEDEEVWSGGFHMEEELLSAAPSRPLLESEAAVAASKRPPSLSPFTLAPPPLSPSSPLLSLSARRWSQSLPSAVPPSSHPVLSLECAEGGSNLSGGFAQSVALSRVFLRPSSQLVILDEAMGAMDPIKKMDHIVPRLMERVQQRGQCLLVVTHDVRLICPLVDCVYVLEHGTLLLSGSHAELMERRAQPYLRMFGEA